MTGKELGRALRVLRAKAGLSQAELAAKIDGLGAGDVSRYEGASREPGAVRLWELLVAMGCTFVDLDRALGVDPADSDTAERARKALERADELKVELAVLKGRLDRMAAALAGKGT